MMVTMNNDTPGRAMCLARRLIIVCCACLPAMPGFAGDFETRIFGGKDAPENQWPWMTALLIASEPDNFLAQFCGGFLIAPEWVMTAAHCVTEFSDPSELDVLVDEVDLNDDAPRETLQAIYSHPDYDPSNSEDNDIALLHLAAPVVARPASLASRTLDAAFGDLGNDSATALGWGKLAPEEEENCSKNCFPTTLQQVDLDPVPFSTCKNAWGNSLTSNMICAREFEPEAIEPDDQGDDTPTDPNGEDTCSGDSGGPLVIDGASGRVAGITSFGSDTDCGNPDAPPGVYTRVVNYAGWVETTTATAGDPLVDVTSRFKPSKGRVNPGGDFFLDLVLANDSLNNQASGLTLTLDIPDAVSMDNLNAGGGLICTESASQWQCTPDTGSAPLPAGDSVFARLQVFHLNNGRERLSFPIEVKATESDYRTANDKRTPTMLFAFPDDGEDDEDDNERLVAGYLLLRGGDGTWLLPLLILAGCRRWKKRSSQMIR